MYNNLPRSDSNALSKDVFEMRYRKFAVTRLRDYTKPSVEERERKIWMVMIGTE